MNTAVTRSAYLFVQKMCLKVYVLSYSRAKPADGRQIKGKNQHKVSQYGVKPPPASSDDQHSSTRY